MQSAGVETFSSQMVESSQASEERLRELVRYVRYVRSEFDEVGMYPYERSATQSNPVSKRTYEIPREPPDLEDALLDLHSVRREAGEEGYSILPEKQAIQEAERGLRMLYWSFPRPYAVYPMPDGDIAIDAPSPSGTKVVVLYSPDGSARGLVYLGEQFTRQDYDDPSLILNDPFIRKALRQTQVTSDSSS